MGAFKQMDENTAISLETRLKRLKIRCWRRGTREMDLILGGYADQEFPGLTAARIDEFERLLEESDHDIYGWISGFPAPASYAGLLALIKRR